jgi:hypothetical protein
MSDAFFHWYTSSWAPEQAERLVAWLSARGLTVDNPVTGEIIVLRLTDDLPERTAITRSDAVQGLALLHEDEFQLQFWLTGEADVYCRARRVNRTLVACEFDLDGKSPSERRQVVTLLMDWIRTQPTTTAGLVADLQGASLETDWDAIMQGKAAAIPIHPTALAVPRATLTALPADLAAKAKETLPALFVIDETGLLT